MRPSLLPLSMILITLGSLSVAQTAQTTESTPPAAEQPQITPQKGQSAAQQHQDLAQCYDIAKAKTGIDPRALAEAAGGKVNLPGIPSGAQTESAAATTAETASQSAPSTDKKSMLDKFQLANEGCLQARGYIVKTPPAPTSSPK